MRDKILIVFVAIVLGLLGFRQIDERLFGQLTDGLQSFFQSKNLQKGNTQTDFENEHNFGRLQDNPTKTDSKIMNKSIKALIVGWTGETGQELLRSMSKSEFITSVTLAGRREMDLAGDVAKEKFVQKIIDFEKVPLDLMTGHDQVFCLLGTTRAKSGKDGFVKVDKDYVINVADAAKAAGVTHFHLMTSAGSSSKSPFLYPQTKGQVEEYCEKLAFEKLTIYQPGLLLCNRTESRTGERIFQGIMKPFYGAFGSSVGAIPCVSVANAMVQSAQEGLTGKKSNSQIEELSKTFLKSLNTFDGSEKEF